MPDLSMVRNLSRAVWREKVDGLPGTEMKRRDSSGEMAVGFVLKMPYLSQLRYLQSPISKVELGDRSIIITNGIQSLRNILPLSEL